MDLVLSIVRNFSYSKLYIVCKVLNIQKRFHVTHLLTYLEVKEVIRNYMKSIYFRYCFVVNLRRVLIVNN